MKKLSCLLALGLTLFAGGCPTEGTADPTQPPTQTSNCEEHTDCGDGYICQGGECRPGECVAELQLECNTEDTPASVLPYCCKVFETCNALNECVARPDSPVGNQCAVDADCPSLGQFCSGGNCFETGGRDACTSSFQCPADERCDRTVYLCVPDNGGCTFADQFEELACEATELCDAETGFCVDPGGAECTPETVADDCRPSEQCDSLGRCVQCITNDDCGPGTACNVATGGCYSIVNRCEDDSECTGDRRCSPATNECITPSCERDADCEDSRELCDLTRFQCYLPPAVCTGEADEPNDTLGTATTIPLSGYAGTLCRSNADFLAFPVQPGKRYRATITFPDFTATGNTAAIHNTSGLPEDTAVIGTSDRDMTVTGIADPDETGHFVLRVSGTGIERDLWSYTVEIEESDAPEEVSCEDEIANGVEPNNTFAEAHELTVGERTSFARCGINDKDYYRVTIPELHRLEVTLESVSDDGDIDLDVFDEENGSRVAGTSSGLDVEKVELPEGKRTFWILAELYSSNSSTTTNQTYSLLARALPRPEACDADVNEPDTTIAQAGELPLDTSVEAIRCGAADVDVFAVTLPGDTGGNLRVDFTHTQGNIRLDLLDAEGNVLESSNTSTSSNGWEALPLPFAASEQTYYARVRVDSGTSTAPQTYTISTSTFDASACTASEPTSNDTFASGTCVGAVVSDVECASSLTPPASWPDLAACSSDTPPAAGCGTLCGVGDPDYYRAGKLNGQLLRAKLTHNAEEGPLGLALVRLGPDGTLSEVMLDNNGEGEDVLELSLVAPTVNELFVREYGVLVRPVGSADYSAQPYAIEIEVGAPCTPDAHEPNNNPGGPSRLRANPVPGDHAEQVSDATLCGGDLDVYEVFLFAGETLTATLSGIEGATVDIGTRVFGDPMEDATTVPCGQGVPSGETAECPDDVNTPPTEYTSPMVATHGATSGDFYYVTVRRMPNGAVGDYTLAIDIDAP